MDPPRLALPANFAHSLRHLDDVQLEELPGRATAEARRRSLADEDAERGSGQGRACLWKR